MNDMMTTGGNLHDMGMNMSLQKMDMNNVMYRERYDTLVTLHYGMLRSPVKTLLPDAHHRIPFRADGKHEPVRLDGEQPRDLGTRQDPDSVGAERKDCDHEQLYDAPPDAPARAFLPGAERSGGLFAAENVIDIMPMETDTIEFNASEGYGDWYFHLPYPLSHDGRYGPDLQLR